MKRLAAIALGSNLSSAWGGPAENIDEAVRRTKALGDLRAISSLRVTAPVGYTSQPDFTNAVLLLETHLEPLDLMHALLDIERAMGRDRSATVPPKGPRLIDLDLLLMEDVVLDTPELTLPHPELASRRFVLEPLAEIAPKMRHPLSGLSAAEMLRSLRQG